MYWLAYKHNMNFTYSFRHIQKDLKGFANKLLILLWIKLKAADIWIEDIWGYNCYLSYCCSRLSKNTIHIWIYAVRKSRFRCTRRLVMRILSPIFAHSFVYYMVYYKLTRNSQLLHQSGLMFWLNITNDLLFEWRAWTRESMIEYAWHVV